MPAVPVLIGGLAELAVRVLWAGDHHHGYAFDMRWNGRPILNPDLMIRHFAPFARAPAGWVAVMGAAEWPLASAIRAAGSADATLPRAWSAIPAGSTALSVTTHGAGPQEQAGPAQAGPAQASIHLSIGAEPFIGYLPSVGSQVGTPETLRVGFSITADLDSVLRFGAAIGADTADRLAESRERAQARERAAGPRAPSRSDLHTPPDAFPFVLDGSALRWAEQAGALPDLLATATDEMRELYEAMVDPDLPADHPDQIGLDQLLLHTFEVAGQQFACDTDEIEGRAIVSVRHTGPAP